MEKLIYPLWKKEGRDGDQFRIELLDQLAPALVANANVRGVRVAVADGAVAEASHKRMVNCHPELPDGMVSVWVNNHGWRDSIDEAVARHVARFSSYLVVEAEPIVNTLYPSAPGERVHGVCHVVFLQRPPRLTQEEWLAIWQGSHTQVAIDTQSTFGYRQNVIIRALGDDLPLDAMIEENFPPEAMTSDHAFYAADDDATMQANLQAMIDSCTRFIDFDRIDVIPMSEYVVKAPS